MPTATEVSVAPITSFQGPYRFLSNFWIEPDGSHVEGEYQAEKSPIAKARGLFNGLTPGQAKRTGRNVGLRCDWNGVKVEIMLNLVRRKFTDHPSLAKLLLDTGDRKLIGVSHGAGSNCLGKILMQVRAELRAAK